MAPCSSGAARATARVLLKSDGTTAGTIRILESEFSAPLFDLTDVNGTLFFVSGGLRKSDGITASIVRASGLIGVRSSLANVNGTVFFVAGDGTHVAALWKSDGTAAGTVPISGAADIQSDLTNLNGTLFFAADDGTHGVELWKSDGTAAGTVMVKDISPGGGGPSPSQLVNVNGTLFFTAADGTGSMGLWKSDGTATGTAPVAEAPSAPAELTAVGDKLFFWSARSSRCGIDLWRSDAAATRAVLVKNIDASFSCAQGDLINVNGNLLILSTDRNQLWKSDGTPEGTVLINAIVSPSPGFLLPFLANVDGTLFFTAGNFTADGQYGLYGLWKSDGTPAGTVLVASFFSPPSDPADVNGTLFFSAGGATHFGLWKTDGTPAGTVPVSDITSSILSPHANVNSTLFFAADDGTHGLELWKSDGTAAGTAPVGDINPGSSGSSPSNFTNVNGALFFTADDGVHGAELWKNDGQRLEPSGRRYQPG